MINFVNCLLRIHGMHEKICELCFEENTLQFTAIVAQLYNRFHVQILTDFLKYEENHK